MAVAKSPSPPSRRGLPTVALPDDADDSAPAWLRRLAGHAYSTASGLHDRAVAIGADADLSEVGRRKAVARHVAGELSRFKRRVAQETRRITAERQHLNERVAKRIGEAAGKLSAAELSEWRSALRALPPAERSELLREAAAGRAPASEQIMAAAVSAASPVLLGLGANDPTFEVVVGQHRERLAEAELREIAELDQAVADAEQAGQWLEAYVVDALVPEHELRDAQAVAAGGKPLSELTLSQKMRRAGEGIAAGLDPRDALYTPTATEGAAGDGEPPLTPADLARFTALPLADRLDAAERGAAKGLSPAEVVKAMTVTTRE